MMKCVPKLNSKFWITLCLASIFGAHVGDYLADEGGLHLGHLEGLPIEALALAVIFMIERMTNLSTTLFYWVGVIVVRAAATNVADSFRDFGIKFPTSMPLVFTLLVAFLIFWKVMQKEKTQRTPLPINAYYWVTMFLAGSMGTLLGDYCIWALHLGALHASYALLAVLAVLFVIGFTTGVISNVFYFWLTITVIRGAFTAVADYMADEDLLGIATATLISGIAYFSFILAVYRNEANKLFNVKPVTA